MPRQRQIKQMWVNMQDEKNAETIIEWLNERGVDLGPETPNAESEISWTKLVRYLLEEKAMSIRAVSRPKSVR